MKIKNCPFCGSEVELKKLPLWEGSHGYPGCYEYVISCDNCGCRKHLGNNDTVYNTDEEAKQNAIDSWNMRAKQVPSKKEQTINFTMGALKSFVGKHDCMTKDINNEYVIKLDDNAKESFVDFSNLLIEKEELIKKLL